MVKLDIINSWNTTLAQTKLPLVAVFFGGAGGIGHQTIRALSTVTAKNGSKGFRAYVVARKSTTAEAVIADCRGICPQAQYIFVKAEDLSLITDVNRVCDQIIELEEKEERPRIDYLMMGHAGSIFLPRKDTKEGLDVTMSLMYYSRMRIITRLLPLLLKSTLPPTIVSVYAAGVEGKLYPDDLSVRDLSYYSYSQARSNMIYMHTWFFETLAEQHRGKLSLVHIFPGLVIGPGYHNPELPLWFRRVVFWFVLPLFGRLITVSPEESGNRMLSLAAPYYPPRPIDSSRTSEEVAVGTDGEPGSGVYSLGWKGEDNLPRKMYEKYDKVEMRKRIWDHTMKAFEVIEAGNVFTE